jgi:osmotically-inducible protein OsmY
MDNNRNQRSSYRSSNQDWDIENPSDRNENYWDNRNSGSSRQMSSNMGDTDYNSRSGRQGDQGNYGNQWNRDSGYGRSEYGRYNSDYNTNQNSGNYGDRGYGSQDRNYGYGGREYGSSYGGGNYQGNSSYWDSGSYGNTGRSSFGNSRNLYDRDYENFNRNEGYRSSASRLGGSNYGGYEDRDRERRGSDEYPFYGSTNMRNYSGSNYGNYYGRSRNFGQGDPNERSWWDRTKDEVSSWFGDDEAERRRERDMRNSHKGRGPKNYTRSDERIKEDINDRLSDDPWVDASEIDVNVSSGEVTLTGTVNDRSDKRRAEDLAEAVSGVKNVENRIRVGQGAYATTTGGTTSGMGTGTTGTYATTSGTTSASQTGTTGTGGTVSGDKKQNKSSFVSN